MKFKVRQDLGGWAADLSGIIDIGSSDFTAPVIGISGGNGSGKSSLLRMVRAATGLVGPGMGRPREIGILEDAMLVGKMPDGSLDLGRAALYVENRHERYSYRGPRQGKLPEDPVPGVLDVREMAWKGQRIFLYDARFVDGEGMSDCAGDDMIGPLRRSRERASKSHGQATLARLRYAIAWAIGIFDLKDSLDFPDREHRRSQASFDAAKAIYKALCGGLPGDAGDKDNQERPAERWLLLDEPETGIAPDVLLAHMAVLLEKAQEGVLKVVLVTHSPVLLRMLENHAKAQVADLDGWAARLNLAMDLATDPEALSAVADHVEEDLRAGVSEANGAKSGKGSIGNDWNLHRSWSVTGGTNIDLEEVSQRAGIPVFPGK